MRAFILLTTICATALWHLPATAETTGRVCKHACGPRILEQCGTLEGSQFRRCRRPLVQACKATTPEGACATTADLTRALGDRRLDLGSDSSLRLCEDGSFVLREPAGPPPVPPIRTEGTWRVELADGALVVALDDAQARSFRVEPDGTGGFAVDGTATVATDATDACAPIVGERAPDPVLDLRDPERVGAVTRAVTDRQIARGTVDDNGQPLLQILTLCSSGAVRAVRLPVTLIAEPDEGTWQIDETGRTLGLSLRSELLPASFDVRVDDLGRVFLDGDETRVRNARDECTDLDIAARVRTRLTRTAYVLPFTVGPVTLQTTLAFCSDDRFERQNGFNLTIEGSWTVESENADPRLVMQATGLADAEIPLTLDGDGRVLIDGNPPLDDSEATVAAICD